MGARYATKPINYTEGIAMKTKYILMIMIMIFYFISGFSYIEGNETLEFDLTKERINKAFVKYFSEDKYAVVVYLKEPYKTYFSDLTNKNISKRLSITFCRETLISPIIKGKVDTGIIEVGTWNFEENAKQFSIELLSKNKVNCDKIRSILRTRTGYEVKKYVKEALACLSEFQIHNDLHSLNKGIEIIEKAIDSDRGYALAYYWKALMLSKKRENEKAILTLSEGIKESDKDDNDKIVNLYFFRGVLQQIKGLKKKSYIDYSKAVDIYKDRLKCDLKNWDAMMNITQILALMDRKKEAVNLLNDTIERYPDEEIPKQLLKDLEQFNVTKYLENIKCEGSVGKSDLGMQILHFF